MEIVLVNSMSTDNTLNNMLSFANEDNGFIRVAVVDNPKKNQAAGWNTAIMTSSEDVFIKVDAHASIPNNFVSMNVKCIKSGENICGGPRPTIAEERTHWRDTLQLAESSMFGSSFAPYRRRSGRTYVNSVFNGAYRREVFAKVGGFNERLGRTEDNEMHYRIRKAGYKLCYDPSIISYQHIRSSLKCMLKQKYGNGYWVGLTLGVCPGCLSIFHFVPFAFVCGIVITSIFSLFGIGIFSLTMWCLYCALAIIMSVTSVKKQDRNRTNFFIPLVFLMLHLCYGIGTTIGLVKMPFLRSLLKDCGGIDEVKEMVLKKINNRGAYING
jgi:cellulose synthase/poly-beta-1,6-N-acetylglucosamine synthase-like glycosyltransferase